MFSCAAFTYKNVIRSRPVSWYSSLDCFLSLLFLFLVCVCRCSNLPPSVSSAPWEFASLVCAVLAAAYAVSCFTLPTSKAEKGTRRRVLVCSSCSFCRNYSERKQKEISEVKRAKKKKKTCGLLILLIPVSSSSSAWWRSASNVFLESRWSSSGCSLSSGRTRSGRRQ